MLGCSYPGSPAWRPGDPHIACSFVFLHHPSNGGLGTSQPFSEEQADSVGCSGPLASRDLSCSGQRVVLALCRLAWLRGSGQPAPFRILCGGPAPWSRRGLCEGGKTSWSLSQHLDTFEGPALLGAAPCCRRPRAKCGFSSLQTRSWLPGWFWGLQGPEIPAERSGDRPGRGRCWTSHMQTSHRAVHIHYTSSYKSSYLSFKKRFANDTQPHTCRGQRSVLALSCSVTCHRVPSGADPGTHAPQPCQPRPWLAEGTMALSLCCPSRSRPLVPSALEWMSAPKQGPPESKLAPRRGGSISRPEP